MALTDEQRALARECAKAWGQGRAARAAQLPDTANPHALPCTPADYVARTGDAYTARVNVAWRDGWLYGDRAAKLAHTTRRFKPAAPRKRR